MAITTERLEIACGDVTMRALVAWDDALGPRPGILIAHNFMGLTDHAESKAHAVAALGYVGLVIDYLAKPAPANGFAQALEWMAELTADRRVVQARMLAGMDRLRALDSVQADRVAAIGYCLGGKCVLDLARSGHAFDGGVVFHGVFDPPPFANADTIVPRLLVCHGWDDPLAKPEAAVALAAELTTGEADWQLHAYGHVVHNFTDRSNPDAYNAAADKRSWDAMCNFFAELWA